MSLTSKASPAITGAAEESRMDADDQHDTGMETDTPSNPSASASRPLDLGKKTLFPKPPDDALGLGEFMFELGCAYCLYRALYMREMLFHHQMAHQGPRKIFYVLRWWDSMTRYWMCPLCQHVEMDEGASTSHHHAFLDHNKEEICQPDPETSPEDVHAFVLHHWDTTLNELLLCGRVRRPQFKAGEYSSMRLLQLEHDDVLLKDYLPAWRQDLLCSTRVKPQLRLPARVWRSWVETGNDSMTCSMCAHSTCLSPEDVMQSHVEEHVSGKLYFCPHCQYNQTNISEVVNHVAFSHREEILEVYSFLRSPVPAVADGGTDRQEAEVICLSDDEPQHSMQADDSTGGDTPDHPVADDKNKYIHIAPKPSPIVKTVVNTPKCDAERQDTSVAGKSVSQQSNTPLDMSMPRKTASHTSSAGGKVIPVAPSSLKTTTTHTSSAGGKVITIAPSSLKPPITNTPPDAVPLKDYMLICAYCWHKAKTCNEMAEHFANGHKRQVRKVLYMVHHEGYEQSHWACPLCRFVREEDKKHMVQLHVFSKHGREDMLYPGLRYSGKNIHKYLAILWTSLVMPCLNPEGEVETDSMEKGIVARNLGPFVTGAARTPMASSKVTNGGTFTSATPTTTSPSTPVSAPLPPSQKLSSISDQIVLLDADASQDNDNDDVDVPEIVEIGHLNEDMQRVLQQAYTRTQSSKTYCKLCNYYAMGSSVMSHLLEHVMLHLGDEIWLCPYCYLHKPRRLHMTAHVAHTHPKELLRIMRYIPSYSRYISMLKTLKNIYVWICSLCSRKDTRKILMIQHLRLGHPEHEFSLHKLKKGFLIKINEDKMKQILQQQNLKPRVKLHRAETFRRHRFMQLFWEENKVQVVALLDRKRGREALEEAAESDTTAENNADASAQESMDTDTKDGEGPGTDTETINDEAPNMDTEGKDAESPSAETEGKGAESPSTETERKDAESPRTETEGKDTESPRTETEGKDTESPRTETEGKDTESPSMATVASAHESPSTETDSKDDEGPSPSKKPCLTWVEYNLWDSASGGSQSRSSAVTPQSKPRNICQSSNVIRVQNKVGRVSADPASHSTPKVIHVLHPLFCMYCDKINTRNIVQIKRHLFTVHPTQVPVARDIVTKAKKKPQYLYVCPSEDCYFITYSWSEMYDHLGNRHANEKLGFDLTKLPRNSRLPINVRFPVVDHQQAITVQNKPAKNTVGMYCCIHCPYQTTDRAYACLHVQIQHPTSLQGVKDICGSQRLYFCPLKHCSFGTNYESLYQSHRCKDGLPPALQAQTNILPSQDDMKDDKPESDLPSDVKTEPALTSGNASIYYDYDLDAKPKLETDGAVASSGMSDAATTSHYPTSPLTLGSGRTLNAPTPTPILIQPRPDVMEPKDEPVAPITIKPEPEDPPATPYAPVPVMMVQNAYLQK